MKKKLSPKTNFLLYTGNDGKVNIDVFLKDETVWLTQKAIGELFGKERSVITKHLKNIFDSGELEEKSNVQKLHKFKQKHLSALDAQRCSKTP